jgi:hypothetical protein
MQQITDLMSLRGGVLPPKQSPGKIGRKFYKKREIAPLTMTHETGDLLKSVLPGHLLEF